MYALRERRVHVTQEDFELAVAKVRKYQCNKTSQEETDQTDRFRYYQMVVHKNRILRKYFIASTYVVKTLFFVLDYAERLREEHVHQKVMEIIQSTIFMFSSSLAKKSIDTGKLNVYVLLDRLSVLRCVTFVPIIK